MNKPDIYAEIAAYRTDSNKNTNALHPIVVVRLLALFRELDTIFGRGKVQIASAVRTYEQQKYLYETSPPGYAANPDSYHGTNIEGVSLRGSNHQQQEDGWGRAVDLRTYIGWGPVHSRLAKFGLRLAVLDPYEPWHVEATTSSLGPWLNGPWPNPPGWYRPLRRLMNGGDVSSLQRQLKAGSIDGSYGPGTESLVRQFQRSRMLEVDGVWGRGSQQEYENLPMTAKEFVYEARSHVLHAIEAMQKADALVASANPDDLRIKDALENLDSSRRIIARVLKDGDGV
jgi:peptidoglycan hydrolase-like protein with peptidoglycan-binding domain